MQIPNINTFAWVSLCNIAEQRSYKSLYAIVTKVFKGP